MTDLKPNEASLWANQFKQSDKHPDKKGLLSISQSLLKELIEQQGKGNDFVVEVSAWENVTRTGKSVINIKLAKPYKFPIPQRAEASQSTQNTVNPIGSRLPQNDYEDIPF